MLHRHAESDQAPGLPVKLSGMGSTTSGPTDRLALHQGRERVVEGLRLMPVGPEPQIHLAATVVREGTSACSKGVQLLLTQLLCTCVLLLPTRVALLKDVVSAAAGVGNGSI
ncbi:hypothetical protein [Streptomyces sp. 4N124]|uniref:hypothetical protein n=1 Tax=Streptomyces sp. 4N124 TaxID=3457420 RepID=UPI003FD55B00